MAEEWGQRNREAEVTNSGRVTRWVSVILPARFWHSFPCPHSFASIPGFRFIVVTQGVALGWHVTGPLALDTSASQPFFGYQPVFNLSWYYLQEKNLPVKFHREFTAHAKDDPTGFQTLKKVLGETDMIAFQKRWEETMMKLTFP